MPEGQDPYGSFAFYQRIRKESSSAINFRRSMRAGTLQPHLNGYAPQAFVLSNPITHVDRVITPVLRSRLQMVENTVEQLQTKSVRMPLASKTALLPSVAPRNGLGDDYESKTTTADQLRPIEDGYDTHREQPPQLPKLADGSADLNGAGRRRIPSARIVSAPLPRATPTAEKVAVLESVLAQERESRLKVQHELNRLEQLLQQRIARIR